MLRSSAIISLLSLFSSLVNFFNQVLIAKIFGVSIHLDAYLIATSLPLLIIGIIKGLFSYSVVPALVNYRTNNPKNFPSFAGSLLLAFILIALCLSFLACCFTPKLIIFMAPTLSISLLNEAIEIAIILWITIIFIVVSNYLVAVLNSGKQFLIPVLINVLPTIGTITAMTLFASRLGVVSLAWGLLAGNLIAIPILYTRVAKEMVFKIEDLKLWRNFVPIFTNLPLALISMLCFTVYGTVDAIWASRLGPSNLSYLGYGQRLIVSIGTIIILGPWMVLTPYLAEKIALGQDSQFKNMLTKAIRMVIVFSSLVGIIISLLRIPLIKLLFQRGAFDNSSVLGVASILPGMLFGMVAMLGVTLIIKALHARGDVKDAAMIGGFGALMYFLLSGGLSLLIGLNGIVLGYAITWWLLLLISVWRIWKYEIWTWNNSNNLKFNVYLLSALIVSGILMQLSQNFLIKPTVEISSINLALNLIVVAAIGVVSFIGIAGGIFRMPEITLLWKLLS